MNESKTPMTDAAELDLIRSQPGLDEKRVMTAFDFARSFELQLAEAKKWQDAVEDACIVLHLGEALGKPPRECLHRLICYENQIALDPQVSSAAVELRDFYKQERDQLSARVVELENEFHNIKNYCGGDITYSVTDIRFIAARCREMIKLTATPSTALQYLQNLERKAKALDEIVAIANTCKSPSLTTFKQWLHFQYPATEGDCRLNQILEAIEAAMKSSSKDTHR